MLAKLFKVFLTNALAREQVDKLSCYRLSVVCFPYPAAPAPPG